MKNKRYTMIIALILTTVLLMSCNLIPSQQETTQSQETIVPQSQPKDTSTDTEPKGQVIMSGRIDNTDGGYFIPIPDSWFGKVSYELDGAHTYIYHITIDGNQPEVNPVLLHIHTDQNVSDDTPGINIFMNMGATQFYQILRMDAPYLRGTDDETEFLMLYEDIPMVLQSVWVIDESIWQMQIEVTPIPLATTAPAPPPPSPAAISPFDQYDATLGGVNLGAATISQTLAVISESPISTESITWGATGEVEDKYIYSFGRVSFIDGILAIVSLETSAMAGPRGFRVGNDIDDVIASFISPSQLEYDNSDYKVYYRGNPGDSAEIFLPDAAYIRKNIGGGESALILNSYDVMEDLSGMTLNDLKEHYIYMAYYECAFVYNTSSGTITKIYMDNLADAE